MDHAEHAHDHAGRGGGSVNAMAVSATLHCLTGCAIGEIAGLMIGTALGLDDLATIALAVALAFLFGYTLSTLPLLKAGLGLGAALSIVLAADTLSIATMEVVDNLVMATIPGAMDAGLVNVVFWIGMMIALTVAFFAAYPVNRYLLQRGKGHALTHGYHGSAPASGARRYIPSFATSTLVAVIVAFMLGGLVVSIADELGDVEDAGGGHAQPAFTDSAPAARPHPGAPAALSHLDGPPARLRHSALPAHPSGDARDGDDRRIQAQGWVIDSTSSASSSWASVSSPRST